MKNLEQLCAYIIKNTNNEMTDLRLSFLVYLCDWSSALKSGETITSKRYQYENRLIKNDIVEDLKYSMNFRIGREINKYKSQKTFVHLTRPNDDIYLNDRYKEIVDPILKKFEKLYFDDLVAAVANSYPLNQRTIYTNLNLEQSALDLKKISVSKN